MKNYKWNPNKIWEKHFGTSISSIDFAGRRIRKSEYNTDSKFSWNIDHIQPLSYGHGGTDSIKNLIPVHFLTNKEKSNNFPKFTANKIDFEAVPANGEELDWKIINLDKNKEKNMNEKSFRFALVGPGAVGKSTVISFLNDYLINNGFEKIDEREYIDLGFGGYMSDMKSHAFNTQVKFFSKRLEQIKRLSSENRALMDRHLIDDFIFPQAHIAVGNFSEAEANEWKNIEKKYWEELSKLPKLDLVIILLAPYETIQKRREERAKIEEFRKEELNNDAFFEKVNRIYYDKESVLYKAADEFANEKLIIENFNSKETAINIREIIDRKING